MLKKFVKWLTTNGATTPEVNTSNSVSNEPNESVEPVLPPLQEEPIAESKTVNVIDDLAARPAQSVLVKSYQERMRQDLQSLFDNPPSRQVIKLIPQEYPGPLFIKKPVIIDGQGATLWAFKGPVLHLRAPTVALKNLTIEVTGDTFTNSSEECALWVDSATSVHFENVQIRGQVIGLSEESGEWQYPHSLHLGNLAKNMTHRFRLRIAIPTPCSMESAIYGLHLTPATLAAGFREIDIKIDPLRQDTSLYGNLYLNTALLKRRIHLTAHISGEADSVTPAVIRVIWSPSNWPAATSSTPAISAPSSTPAISAPPPATTTMSPPSPPVSPRKLSKVSESPAQKRPLKNSTKESTPATSKESISATSLPEKPWLATTSAAATSGVSKSPSGRMEDSIFFRQGVRSTSSLQKPALANEEKPEAEEKGENVFLKAVSKR